MKAFSIVFFALLACCLGRSIQGGDRVASRVYKIRVSQFANLSEKDSDKISEEILKGYSDITGDLIGQLQQEKNPDEAKVYLIYLLGELRDVRAASSLVELIDLKAPRIDPRLRIPRWGEYPAAEALAKIGIKAIRFVVLKLPQEQTKLRRKLMVTVIWEVQGEKSGRAVLEEALARQTTDAARANMKASLEAFDALTAIERKKLN